MDAKNIILVPYPKKLVFTSDYLVIRNRVCICMPHEDKDAMFFSAKRLQGVLEEFPPVEAAILIGRPYPDRQAIIFEKDSSLPEEGYAMTADIEGINICFGDCQGAFHAVSTLKQIIKQCGKTIPCFKIEDEPEFKARGIMIDISRNKIPTMETLFRFVDFMADLKYNQLQLYIEGFSFAYPSFPGVWKHETPVTGEEIMQIDRYCRERFIDLVPNQNSFGHMGAWLAKEEFKDLAESPDGFRPPWAPTEICKPMTLNPRDPQSLEFVKKITADLLPYFSSGLFNVGFDETLELQKVQEMMERIAVLYHVKSYVTYEQIPGKSSDFCEKEGTGRVYLDFLLKVYSIAKKQGKRIMFWGDMITSYPEVMEKLPDDVIALEWGYEHDHPFDEFGKMYREAGVQFYVCPGTSYWSSISGRTDNMTMNLLNAAVNGKKNGACGYLVTDWGNNGRYEYQPAFVYGAGLSWNVENNSKMNIGLFMDRFVFRDRKGITGKCLLELGNYYQKEMNRYYDTTYMFRILTASIDDMRVMEGLNASILDDIKDYVLNLVNLYNEGEMECEGARLADAEFRNTARIIVHLSQTGKLKLLLKSSQGESSHVKSLCEFLLDDITGIIIEYKKLWLSRNRPGGLERSLRSFGNLKIQYEKIIDNIKSTGE